jgi:hypothetical protein
MVRLREWMLKFLGLRRRTSLDTIQRSERMEALFQAKDRARDGTVPPSQPSAPLEVLQSIEDEKSETPEKELEPEFSAPQESSKPLTKTLLERKKEQRKKRE